MLALAHCAIMSAITEKGWSDAASLLAVSNFDRPAM